jgi:hypothetical protein
MNSWPDRVTDTLLLTLLTSTVATCNYTREMLRFSRLVNPHNHMLLFLLWYFHFLFSDPICLSCGVRIFEDFFKNKLVMFKKYILWNNTFLKNNIRLKVVTNKKKHNISTKIIKWIPQITIKNKKWKKKL